MDHGMLQSLPIQESVNITIGQDTITTVPWSIVGQSINKMQTIQLKIENKDISYCTLTETWIKEDDDLTPLCICPSGYKSVSIPRLGKTGWRTCLGT